MDDLREQLRDVQEQLARERLANRELALRLQAQRDDALRREELLDSLRSTISTAATRARDGVTTRQLGLRADEASDSESTINARGSEEVATLKRILAAVARGKDLDAAIRFQASFCRMPLSIQGFFTNLGLEAALRPYPAPLLDASPLADCILVTGPDIAQLSRALQDCRTAAAATRIELEPVVLSELHAGPASGERTTCGPLSAAAAQYCFPQGCILKVGSTCVNLSSHVAASDHFFGNRPTRRGPQTHLFILSGDALGNTDAQADAAREAAMHAGHPTNGRARYCMCVQASVPLLVAPPPKLLEPSGPERYAAPSAGVSVLVPLAFCLVSRYPFFPLHFAAIQAAVAVWRSALASSLLASLPEWVPYEEPSALGVGPSGPTLAQGRASDHEEIRGPTPTSVPCVSVVPALRRHSDVASHGQPPARQLPTFVAGSAAVDAQPSWRSLIQRGITTARMLVPSTADREGGQSADVRHKLTVPSISLSSFVRGGATGNGLPAAMEGLDRMERDETIAAHISTVTASMSDPSLHDFVYRLLRSDVPAPGDTIELHVPMLNAGAHHAASSRMLDTGTLQYTRPLSSTFADIAETRFLGGLPLRGHDSAEQLAEAGLSAMSVSLLLRSSFRASLTAQHRLAWPRDLCNDSESAAGSLLAASARPPTWLLGRDFSHSETWAAAVDWAAPVLFSVLPIDSVLLLLGAALTEQSVVLVAGDLSLEALSCCTIALACLLQPLSWVGAFQPLLPKSMTHLLDAPTPLLVGVASLPADFVQDERMVVAYLDRETVRVCHTPGGTTAQSARSSAGRGALESHADVLRLQLPGNSALYNRLEPVAAQLRVGSGTGSGVTIAADCTARPCYYPTSTQRDASVLLSTALCCYVRGLLSAVFGAADVRSAAVSANAWHEYVHKLRVSLFVQTASQPQCPVNAESPYPCGAASGSGLPSLSVCRVRILAACSESEEPFWSAFLSTQMLAYFVECQNDLAQAAEAGTRS